MLELSEDVFEKVVERWGIFVMIATGESILALISTTNKIDDSNTAQEELVFEHYISVFCAFGITYLISHYYLESSKVNSMHFHALMEPDTPGSVCWTLLHGVLAYFLMIVGAGWKLILASLSLETCWYKHSNNHYYCCKSYNVNDCKYYDGSGWTEFSYFLGASLCLSLCVMYWIRVAHVKFIFSWKSALFRFLIILSLPFGALWTSSFKIQSFWFSIWCLLVLLIGFFVDHLFIDIYQTDIKPQLRTFYDSKISPELRKATVEMHLKSGKRRSLEFTRSQSISKQGSSGHGHH